MSMKKQPQWVNEIIAVLALGGLGTLIGTILGLSLR